MDFEKGLKQQDRPKTCLISVLDHALTHLIFTFSLEQVSHWLTPYQARKQMKL